MKRFVGFSTSVALCVGLVFGLTGCQSGWKISNPFAPHPRAASAETPEELDALDDMDELTPPPENYTVGDASKSDRSESLAQKGRYEVEDKASDVEKLESETRAIAEKTDSYKSQDSYQVADYNQSYQTSAPSGVGDYSGQNQAPTQTYAQVNPTPQQSYSPMEQSAPQSPQQSYAQSEQAFQQPYSPTNQFAQQSYEQPYVQTNQAPAQTTEQSYAQVPATSGFQSYSAPGAGMDVATNGRFEPTQSADPYNANGFGTSSEVGSGFPTPDSSFPAIQNSSVAVAEDFPQVTFGAAPSSSQSVNVAMNPDSVVTGSTPVQSQPATYTTGAPTDSDPYSDVYYAPQTTSSGAGFAPGSAGLY